MPHIQKYLFAAGTGNKFAGIRVPKSYLRLIESKELISQ
jgi:hypothetical protein